jgi:hypothetical protein
MVMAPPDKLMPSVPLAGVMAWVRLLTLSVVTGVVKLIPADWLPVQVATVPPADKVQASGPASAGPPIANDSAPAAAVLKSASRRRKPRSRAPAASASRAAPAKPAIATCLEATDMMAPNAR